MIQEIYFLEDANTGLKILVFQDLLPKEERTSRGEHQRVMCHFGVQQLLSDSSVSIDHLPSGAPFIPQRPDLHLSVSHSADYYALMIHPSCAVGIDIQETRPNGFPSALHYFLSDEELEAAWTEKECYLLWCAKEAMYKLKGGELDNYREDMQIQEIAAGILHARIKDEFVSCVHRFLRPGLLLVYCYSKNLARKQPLPRL